MKNKLPVFFFCFLFIATQAFCQSNIFSGTWQVENINAGNPRIQMQLKIGEPEKNLLYPAHIKIQYKNFVGEYDLLLVRKNSRQLVISKNKFALYETPFSISNAMFYFNGTLNLSRDLKGLLNLHLIRIQPLQTNFSGIFSLKNDTASLAEKLNYILKETDIRFVKINDSAWKDKNAAKILMPALSPIYFGLSDTFYTKTRESKLSLSDAKKNDIASLSLNGITVIDMLTGSKKTHKEDLLLDTGMNVLILFADNFGEGTPNKTKLSITLNHKDIPLYFTTSADSAAAFIAVKIYCNADNEGNNYFKNYPAIPQIKLQPNDKLVGSIATTAQQIKLAIWDDAIEDGDSISINVNGKFIAKGFRVKKKPQFITITLVPGINTINFIADNLGSIPPNTSVLEIIDGKKRKSYTLETIPGDNNFVKIFYDVNNDVQ
jgi:hypothetical protein